MVARPFTNGLFDPSCDFVVARPIDIGTARFPIGVAFDKAAVEPRILRRLYRLRYIKVGVPLAVLAAAAAVPRPKPMPPPPKPVPVAWKPPAERMQERGADPDPLPKPALRPPPRPQQRGM